MNKTEMSHKDYMDTNSSLPDPSVSCTLFNADDFSRGASATYLVAHLASHC